MTSYERIVDYIEEISNRIEAEYPELDFSLLVVWLVFKPITSTTVYDGLCHTGYKKTKMKIEILLPQMNTVSAADKRNLALILMHEYCHYIDALQQSAEERHQESLRYASDTKHASIDERRTWGQTRALAIKLNLWSKRMYTLCRRYKHTSGMEF